MASAPSLKIPQPLSSTEIRTGLALRIAATVPGISPEKAKEIREAVFVGLHNTCNLNEASYAKFSAKWTVREKDGAYLWWCDYSLDDFGRPVTGGIGGKVGVVKESFPPDCSSYSGSVEEMPPDRFRRETEQPIPQAQVVKKKNEEGLGLSRAQKRGGKRGVRV
jgi:hypothetical protein